MKNCLVLQAFHRAGILVRIEIRIYTELEVTFKWRGIRYRLEGVKYFVLIPEI